MNHIEPYRHSQPQLTHGLRAAALLTRATCNLEADQEAQGRLEHGRSCHQIYRAHTVLTAQNLWWVSKLKLCWKVSWGQPHILVRSIPTQSPNASPRAPQLTASSSSNLFYLSTFYCDCVTFWCSMFFIQLLFCCQTAPNTMWILSQMHRPWIHESWTYQEVTSKSLKWFLLGKSWTLADRNTTDSPKEWRPVGSPKHHCGATLEVNWVPCIFFGARNLLGSQTMTRKLTCKTTMSKRKDLHLSKHSWWWNPLKWPWICSWFELALIKNLPMVANDDVVGGGVKPSSVPRNVKEEVAPALEYARGDLSLIVCKGRLTSEKTLWATQHPEIVMLDWTGSAPPILANSDRNAMCRAIFKLHAQNSFKGKIHFGWGLMRINFGICHVVWTDAGHEILQWRLAVFSADMKRKFCLVIALRHTLLKDWLVLCDRVMIWKKPHTDQSWIRLSRTYKFDLVVVACAPPLFALSVWSSIVRPSCACHVGTGSLEAEHRCVLTRLGILWAAGRPQTTSHKWHHRNCKHLLRGCSHPARAWRV